MDIPGWFLWLFGGMSVFFTVIPLLMLLGANSKYEEEQAIKLMAGWWGGVVTVVGTTLAMTFVIKPIIQFVLDLF